MVTENKIYKIAAGTTSLTGPFIVTDGGSGYAMGDLVRPVNGTVVNGINGVLQVVAESGGVILGVAIVPPNSNSGVYSSNPSPLVSNPVSTITGGGSGAEITLTMESSGFILLDPNNEGKLDLSGLKHGSLMLPSLEAGVESGLSFPVGAVHYRKTDGKFHGNWNGADLAFANANDITPAQDMQSTYDEGREINMLPVDTGDIAWFSFEKSVNFGVIQNAGTGYLALDVLTVSGGTPIISATIRIDTVGGSGEVLTFTKLDSGLYNADPSPLLSNPMTGGAGAGFTIDLNMFQGGSIDFDPGSTRVIDLSGSDHGGLGLSQVPTGHESILTTETGVFWFDPLLNVCKYSDGTSIKTVQEALPAFTEGAVLFGGAAGEIDSSVDDIFFDKSAGNFSVGASVQDVELNGATATAKISGFGNVSGVFQGKIQVNYSNAATSQNTEYFLASRGSQGSEIKVEPNDGLGTILFGGWDGAVVNPGFHTSAGIDVQVDDTVADGSIPTNMEIFVNNPDQATGCSLNLSSDGSMQFLSAGIATSTRTLLCDFASNIRLASSEVTLSNDLEIEGQETRHTGAVIGASYTPETLMRVIADEAIAIGDAVTASTTTDYRVVKVKSGDSNDVLVIGFAKTSSANPGDEILIAGAELSIALNDTVGALTRGDLVKKSDTVDGQIVKAVGPSGVVGLAAASAGVSSSVRVWHTRSLPEISGGASPLNYAQLEHVTIPAISAPFSSPSIQFTPTTIDTWEAVTSLPTAKSSVSSTSSGEIIIGKTGTYKVSLGVTAGTDSGGNRRNFWGYTVNQPLTDRAIGDVNVLVGHYSTDVEQPINYSNSQIADFTLNDRLTLWYLQSGGGFVQVNMGSANFIVEEIK